MVLTTNTFGANEIKLSRHGLADQAERINEAGVRIAKRVAGERALVAGSIGPTGLIPDAFDAELMTDLTKAGGEKYAKLAALAYRQCFAAGKFVADENGQTYIDTECTNRKRVKEMLGWLVDHAIIDHETDPEKHKRYNEVRGARCGENCPICNPKGEE